MFYTLKNRDYKDVAAVMLRTAAERKIVGKVDMLYAARASNSEGSIIMVAATTIITSIWLRLSYRKEPGEPAARAVYNSPSH